MCCWIIFCFSFELLLSETVIPEDSSFWIPLFPKILLPLFINTLGSVPVARSSSPDLSPTFPKSPGNPRFSVLFIPVGSCLCLPRAIAELQKPEWDKNQWQEIIFPSEHSPNPSSKLRRDLSLGAHPADSKYSTQIHGSDSEAELCLATARLEKVLFHRGKFLSFFLYISDFRHQS